MSKARELADVIGTQDTTENVLQGRRNAIINGDFQIWQRGTSHSSAGYTADRWYVSSSTYSVAKYESTVVGSYARFTRSIANMYPTTTVEVSNNKFYGKTLTLSFYARTSNDGNIGATITYADDSANTNSIALHTMASEALTTDWARYTTSFTINDAVGGGTQCIRVVLNCTGGTIGHNFDLSQVQLEVGSVATPFEHRSYGEELALCQRYYWKRTFEENTYQHIKIGLLINAAVCMTEWQHPVEMRAAPSFAFAPTASFRVNDGLGHDQTCSNINVTYTKKDYARIEWHKSTSNMNTGYAGYINRETNSTPCWIAADAEL